MLSAVELTLYNENGDSVALDLTPMQAKTICKILLIEPSEHEFTVASDETLKKFWSMKTNPLRLEAL